MGLSRYLSKLAGLVGSDGKVPTAGLADGAITTAKIADANITTTKLADANVTTAKLADASITSAKIADGAILTGDLSDGAVTAAKMAASAVTDKLGFTPLKAQLFGATARTGAYYSRFFRMGIGPLYASAIVSIAHTRNSVVMGSTWIVSGGHSGGARIAQIDGHYYTGGYKVAIEGDGNNDWWFCVYDSAYNADSIAYSNWDCAVVPLVGTLTNIYTSYNAGVAGNIRAELAAGTSAYTSNSTSDERLKTNIQPIENALDKLLLLNGCTFDLYGHREAGLIAQQVLPQLPEVVTGLPPEDIPADVRADIMAQGAYTLGLKYGNLSALFVEAIKELNAKVDAQAVEIQSLRGQA